MRTILTINEKIKIIRYTYLSLTKKPFFHILRDLDALVAQLDRVLGYEPSGRRFESFRVRHFKKKSYKS